MGQRYLTLEQYRAGDVTCNLKVNSTQALRLWGKGSMWILRHFWLGAGRGRYGFKSRDQTSLGSYGTEELVPLGP